MGGLTLDEHMMRRGLEIRGRRLLDRRPCGARFARSAPARPTKKPVDQIIRDELRQKKREARAAPPRARLDDECFRRLVVRGVASSSAASSCAGLPSEAAGPRRGGTARRSHDDLDAQHGRAPGLGRVRAARRVRTAARRMTSSCVRRGEGGGGRDPPGARRRAHARAMPRPRRACSAGGGGGGGGARLGRRSSSRTRTRAGGRRVGVVAEPAQNAARAFAIVDLDGSGSIEAEELKLARVGEAKSPITARSSS